jgi:DNA gyrase subunit A
MVTSNGQAIRFPVAELRSASRTSGGVRGIKLQKGGRVVSLEVVQDNWELFSISEHGFGKRTPFGDYPAHHRGGQGVRNYEITKKTGECITARAVNAKQELIVISRDGIVIRTRMDQIRMTGRSAQGVNVINLGQGDTVAALATIDMANGNGGPRGETATQAALEGMDDETAAEPPATGKSKKPTPIRGRQQQPKDRGSQPQRAATKSPPKPAAKRAPAKPAAKKSAPSPKKPPPAAKKSPKPAAKKPASRSKPAPKRKR